MKGPLAISIHGLNFTFYLFFWLLYLVLLLEMLCLIWYHLYNLKNVKMTHGGVLLLIKLQVEATLKKPSLASQLYDVSNPF